MQQKLMTIVLLALLAGCAQSQSEQPRANGAYLVIDEGRAWTVLVADGERREEAGWVLDVIRLPEAPSGVVASYLIETPNCGRVQWLSQRQDDSQGLGARLQAVPGEAMQRPGCLVGQGRLWTALDYSG